MAKGFGSLATLPPLRRYDARAAWQVDPEGDGRVDGVKGGGGREQQTADRKQQTAGSKQQTGNSRQQTANSKEETANSERQTANSEQRTETKLPGR
jgi:hypothetical protein